MNHPELSLLANYLTVGAVLFGIGLVGFVSRRNMIVMFLSAEIMLQGVSLSFVAWGRYHQDLGGQVFVVLIIAVAACEAAIAMAMVLAISARGGNLDIAALDQLRESNQPAFVDRELPEESAGPPPAWPHLAPAGREPEIPREETDYRPHV